MSSVRIGTAGWTIPSGSAGEVANEGSHLERYSRRLNAVEINTSFYRPHKKATYQRWANSTPDDFRFAVKFPKAITHEARLVGYHQPLERFADEVSGLGEKLGVLLIQLPPSLSYSQSIAEHFFGDLRGRFDVAIALEPRHVTWSTPGPKNLLAQHKIARVAADPPRFPGADTPSGWQGLAYYRWHGSPHIYFSNYDNVALAKLAEQISSHADGEQQVWCIFDNTARGAAFENALEMSRGILEHADQTSRTQL